MRQGTICIFINAFSFFDYMFKLQKSPVKSRGFLFSGSGGTVYTAGLDPAHLCNEGSNPSFSTSFRDGMNT